MEFDPSINNIGYGEKLPNFSRFHDNFGGVSFLVSFSSIKLKFISGEFFQEWF
jgi:hypothetical protein